MTNIHASPRQAAEVAADAGVDTLVLTHLNPYRDPAAMRANAAEVFDGEVRVAEDGLSFSL